MGTKSSDELVIGRPSRSCDQLVSKVTRQRVQVARQRVKVRLASASVVTVELSFFPRQARMGGFRYREAFVVSAQVEASWYDFGLVTSPKKGFLV